MVQTLLKLVLQIGLFLGFLIGTFFWFEAEKEVRILCSMFEADQHKEHVFETLDTGNLLEYRSKSHENGPGLVVDSPFMLWSGRCTIKFSAEGIVQSAGYSQTFKLEKITAWMGVTGLLLIAFFHMLAASGRSSRLKFGRFGENQLSLNSRIGLGIYGVTLATGAFFLLEHSGITHTLPNALPTTYAIWVLVILLGLTIATNCKWKLRYRTSLSVFSLCCCIIVGMAS